MTLPILACRLRRAALFVGLTRAAIAIIIRCLADLRAGCQSSSSAHQTGV